MTSPNYFYSISDHLKQITGDALQFTCFFSGEESDFVRFNQGKVRQAGAVSQKVLNLTLIKGKKNLKLQTSLTGDLKVDQESLTKTIQVEKEKLEHVPDDPFLLISNTNHSNETVKTDNLIKPQEMTEQVLQTAKGNDFVGILAAGKIHRGFANSFGQKNWLSNSNFNLDYSVYLQKDKAVKSSLAGFEWDQEKFDAQFSQVHKQLEILNRPSKTIAPGKYNVFLSPSAVNEVIDLLAWEDFGEKAKQTKQSAFLRLHQKNEELSPKLSIEENTNEGIGPAFQQEGFVRPQSTVLIENGKHVNSLISPRTAKEYNLETNGASASESPESLVVKPGNLKNQDILQAIDTGILINNLWYLNYSDKAAGRITGMTRFACFWVEKGKIQAPLNVMRFDESIYNLLGSNLVELTQERDFIISNSTYGQRSTSSANLPGILVKDFNLTL